MKAFVNRLVRSEFLRHTAILTSGTTLAQAITVFTAPILTRIYHPQHYDVLGLYIMVTGIIGSLVSLQYHNVIVTSSNDDEARLALSMCIAIAVFVASLTLVLTFALFPFISSWLHNDSIRYWLLLAPLSVFFGGWNIAFGSWANRKKQFKLISSNRIFAAILIPVLSISLGLLIAGPAGLMIGLLVSQVLPAILLSQHFFRTNSARLNFGWNNFKKLANRHAAFPKYSLPSEFINNVINQLPVMMFAGLAPMQGVIGNYNLSNRMLGMPIQLVASSVMEVYRQRASTEYHEKGNCHRTFMQTFKILFFSSLVPFVILALMGPWIFKTVFGMHWEMAGRFSQIMAPLFFLKFIVSPLSYVFYITGKQKEDLAAHLVMVVLVVLSFVITSSISDNYYYLLIGYSIAYCLVYLYYLTRSYQFSKGS